MCGNNKSCNKRKKNIGESVNKNEWYCFECGGRGVYK